MFENFDNSFLRLPPQMHEVVEPAKCLDPNLIAYNETLDQELSLNLSDLPKQDLAAYFTGAKSFKNAGMYSMVYAGHQFGHFNPQLGDGRAIMIGEVKNSSGERYDIQLKGAGATPYSRRGDGKSPLGPVLREYLVSEAMHALGIPTTRALACCETGDRVFREEVLPGGVFTRVAKSHLRVGSLQYFFFKQDFQNLKVLLDYSIDRLGDEEVKKSENPYLAFLKQIIKQQLALVSQWKSVGFIHGVMNTDNTSLASETIDFGPCAFMDEFKRNRVFSFIDKDGRYSYNNQFPIIKWNMYRLAECFIPFVHKNDKTSIALIEVELEKMDEIFESQWLQVMAPKFGLSSNKSELSQIIKSWFGHLEHQSLDFTNSFRNLSDYYQNENILDEYGKKFVSLWSQAIDKQPLKTDEVFLSMNDVNPYIIPRNHLVEKTIKLGYQGDYELFYELHKALRNPFIKNADYIDFTKPPRDEEVVPNTFCGT